ncbi:hypothetical protein HAX54_024127 [Datura stramonium]|uniref:Uncharacterized protein n=1 Tax=Datura stramonium TaxID=4076 RepID=A0ABS8UYN6_DATST|nr:hypothetical protein [Datura stramonium]
MTCESALLYLDLPSSVLIAEAVLPLTDAAKQFLAERFKDITKFQDEVLNLPLQELRLFSPMTIFRLLQKMLSTTLC